MKVEKFARKKNRRFKKKQFEETLKNGLHKILSKIRKEGRQN